MCTRPFPRRSFHFLRAVHNFLMQNRAKQKSFEITVDNFMNEMLYYRHKLSTFFGLVTVRQAKPDIMLGAEVSASGIMSGLFFCPDGRQPGLGWKEEERP